MAMADGVFMRTESAWAVALADGTVRTGRVRPNPFRKIPVIRLLVGLVAMMVVAIRRSFSGPRDRARPGSRRFLLVLLAVLAADFWIGPRVAPSSASAGPQVLHHFGLFAVVLAAMKVMMPAALWRYHGAEHKAIAAYEAGLDLDNLDAVERVSPIHDRCGTNLVFLIMLVTAVPLPGGAWEWVLPWLIIGSVAEVLTYALRKHPRSPVTRALVAGGRLLQRLVTIRETQRDELAVGVRSLKACLAEHQSAVTGAAAAA